MYRDGTVTLRTIEFGCIKVLKGFFLDIICRRKRVPTIDESMLHGSAVLDYRLFHNIVTFQNFYKSFIIFPGGNRIEGI